MARKPISKKTLLKNKASSKKYNEGGASRRKEESKGDYSKGIKNMSGFFKRKDAAAKKRSSGWSS